MNETTPARSLKVTSTGHGFALVTITDKGSSKDYLVRPLPQGYRWEELGGEQAYEVEAGRCQCKGHQFRHRRGGQPCRHVAATAALARAGRLPA